MSGVWRHLADMGLDFESPKKTDLKAWVYIKTLYKVGITFHSCGCSGPGYIPKNDEEIREYYRRTLIVYKIHLSFWLGRTKPKTKPELDREKSKKSNFLVNIPAELTPTKGPIKTADARAYWNEKIGQLKQK